MEVAALDASEQDLRRTRTRYLVSPFLARVLFVVAAAIRSAVLLDRPRAVSLFLMCSYWRLRFALFTPRGGMDGPPRNSYLFDRRDGKIRTIRRLRRYTSEHANPPHRRGLASGRGMRPGRDRPE